MLLRRAPTHCRQGLPAAATCPSCERGSGTSGLVPMRAQLGVSGSRGLDPPYTIRRILRIRSRPSCMSAGHLAAFGGAAGAGIGALLAMVGVVLSALGGAGVAQLCA